MATKDKYDRQLRLWGAKGQRALAETTVILIRATAAGTETLKNLVLPGIGHFHVVDDVATISNAEISSNFFLASSVTKSRAQVACEYLQELNPDANGTFQHVDDLNSVTDWNNLLTADAAPSSSSGSIHKQTLVIASDLEPILLKQLSMACSGNNVKIPIIMVQSYGLIGLVRIQTPPLALLDPKPTNAPPDLRLVQFFPKFVELAESFDWATLDDQAHGHMPYPLILYKVSQEWKQSHNGQLPKSFAEKQEFRKAIQSKSRDLDKEVNFQEAVDNAYLAYTERTVDCLDEIAGSEPSSSRLGQLLEALKKFIKTHNRPPLNGSIPDMTASTDVYVKLQTIYRDQASNDIEELKSYVSQSTSAAMSDENNGISPAVETVSDEDVTTFCANVFSIARLQTRTLAEEYQSPASEELLEDWVMATYDPYEVKEHTPLVWYLAFRACQLFHQDHGRYPGVSAASDFDWEKEDVPIMQQYIQKVVGQYKLQDNELIRDALVADEEMKIAHEMTRYANAEIHNISSVLGGVASQEAVKIITGQYVPLDNTYVYNGIVSVGGVYKF